MSLSLSVCILWHRRGLLAAFATTQAEHQPKAEERERKQIKRKIKKAVEGQSKEDIRKREHNTPEIASAFTFSTLKEESMETPRPGLKMSLLSNLTAIVLLLIAQCGSWTLASRLGPHKGCLSCKDPLASGSRASRDHAGTTSSTSVLALGEPCGVYTLSCAKGLRCVPPPREHSPLQALLQGRGFCVKHSRPSPTERPHPTGKSSPALSLCLPFQDNVCLLFPVCWRHNDFKTSSLHYNSEGWFLSYMNECSIFVTVKENMQQQHAKACLLC